ncbi:XRE family transcriptional regulator [Plantibacter sp. Leaf171]|uniref:helix-turn-helix transcriptional regulator n=1 Tax=unclassified Plantibacter TaxID=2624265 RepID=UPI0006F4359B|nr:MULTISPECIES: helix-turn-helix transcriptional regulator [unclassified Plantibacter]KQM16419.1 XRE family transcriptional regulator [Plantibacter sp. Leaf1]KQQ52530.1 XRE family transcriptional regulator [Plantibacter sp. Leaf314]KQR59553.1 XRE family transcriptional regulator [Plantibacter sp. Leaf171]
MDNREDVREFLVTRRARIRPEQVELPAGPNRRVPGLRRAEVALLAGMSVEYYSRLERGDLRGASESVLHAIATALVLDDAEREHLFALARAAGPVSTRRPTKPSRTPTVRPGLQVIIDSITAGCAIIRNGRMDILAANALGRAMYVDLFDGSDRPPNLARFCFLDRPHADRFYPDWDAAADATVAILRGEAGRDPHDKGLHDLVGELSTRSEAFRRKWGMHDVRRHTTGRKHFIHPVVGEVDLVFEAAELREDPGLSLMIYAAEPGTPTEEALTLLASWAATRALATTTAPADPH